ncbi:hypothetical protein Tco_1367811 [Tanacetum coccineum]
MVPSPFSGEIPASHRHRRPSFFTTTTATSPSSSPPPHRRHTRIHHLVTTLNVTPHRLSATFISPRHPHHHIQPTPIVTITTKNHQPPHHRDHPTAATTDLPPPPSHHAPPPPPSHHKAKGCLFPGYGSTMGAFSFLSRGTTAVVPPNQDPLEFVANQQMTPPHFNTYQSSYNNPRLQQ